MDGIGIGAELVAGDMVKAALLSSMRSDGDRSEYMAAVTAAPAPAPAANIAMVVLDILVWRDSLWEWAREGGYIWERKGVE